MNQIPNLVILYADRKERDETLDIYYIKSKDFMSYSYCNLSFQLMS